MNSEITLSPARVRDLTQLLDYTQDDEETHFGEVRFEGDTDTRCHIVHPIRRLRKLIEEYEDKK